MEQENGDRVNNVFWNVCRQMRSQIRNTNVLGNWKTLSNKKAYITISKKIKYTSLRPWSSAFKF